MMFRSACLAAAACAMGLSVPVAHAAKPSALYVFGDSLSDTGNAAETGILQTQAGLPITADPNPPSYRNSFSDGPLWIANLAKALGLSAEPSLWLSGFKDVNHIFEAGFVPGNNYAVAGAWAEAVGGTAATNLPKQVAAYLAHTPAHRADPAGLFVVMVGANDVRSAASTASPPSIVALAEQATVAQIKTLVAAGAKRFLVMNMPDLGTVPLFAVKDPPKAPNATKYAQQFNAALQNDLASLARQTGATIELFDTFTTEHNIEAIGIGYGFTDTRDNCFHIAPLNPEPTPNCGKNAYKVTRFVHWDQLHYTSTVSKLWAEDVEFAFSNFLLGN